MGYIWLSFGTYIEDEARCTFILEPEAESVFDFDLYVLEKYRGGLGFASVWDAAATYLRARGVQHSYSRLDHFNRASALAHNHLGWRRVGSAVILRLWSMEVIFASIRPHLSLLVSTAQRASIRLLPDALHKAA